MRPQLTPGVEILLLEDSGQRAIGAKRQILIERADAEWVSFVDDDDLVAWDYVPRVLGVIESDDPPDVVGFRLRYYIDGTQAGVAVHSYRAAEIPAVLGKRWWRKYDRQPNHLNPVRRELAARVGYKPLDFGEDGDYARRLALLNPRPREKFIDEYLYTYLYIPAKQYDHRPKRR